MAVTKLSQIVKLNGSFRNSINLYLNLNKKEKIDSYIPTKSSLNILKRYVGSVKKNKDHSTILIGSYGKGKSHLLLILLAIVSMQRTKENNEIVKSLLKKIRIVDEETFEIVSSVWNKKGRFLPVIISGNTDDVSRSFMIALNDALKRENLMNLMPDTFFSIAEDTICRWKKEYPEVYINYEKALKKKSVSINDIKNGLKVCDPNSLEVFKSVYPSLMGGEQFNPLTGSEVLPMYQSVADKLREQYGYSGIYVVFDEFSKFIEGQEKHSIGGNMKFLQDMCELANESKDTQIYMTMVAHKSIKEYGAYLSEAVINAFTGIEGRIEEVLFNTSSKNSYELIQNAIETDTSRLAEIPEADKYFGRAKVDEYYKIPAFRSAFTNIDFEEIIVKGCYPLSPVSAYALLNISEKVAQNERTLFTFISKEEPKSMAQYVVEHTFNNEWIVTPDKIYDYFQNLFKKEIGNERVHTEWLNAEYAIAKAKETGKIRMLKTLAVINIINKFDEMPPTEEILKIASGLPNASEILNSLVAKELIYKKETNNCYVFKTRAGASLKSEIKRRRVLKDSVNLSQVFSDVSNNQYILPKRYNNTYSMTRYFRFEYLDVVDFLKLENVDVLLHDGKFQDGKVVALYSLDNSNRTEQIMKKVAELTSYNIIVIYTEKPFAMIQDLFHGYAAVVRNRFWGAQTLLPICPEFVLCGVDPTEKKRKKDVNWEEDPQSLDTKFDFTKHNFLSRGGELYYLHLLQGLDGDKNRQNKLEHLLNDLVNGQCQKISKLANYVQESWEEQYLLDKTALSQKLEVAYIPATGYKECGRSSVDELISYLSCKLHPIKCFWKNYIKIIG